MQVLVAGNTARDQAVKFCREHILPNFKTQNTGQQVSQQICCLQRGEAGTDALPEATVDHIKNIPDEEISAQDKKMFDLI